LPTLDEAKANRVGARGRTKKVKSRCA